MYKYFYLCDGKACKRNCADVGYDMCIHTQDENHARNKVRRNRRFIKDGNLMVENEKTWKDPTTYIVNKEKETTDGEI